MPFLIFIAGVIVGIVCGSIVSHKITSDMKDIKWKETISGMKDHLRELEINNEHLKEQNNKLKEAIHKC